eukprot:2029021-Alexandrium_andersonii.AAC.1
MAQQQMEHCAKVGSALGGGGTGGRVTSRAASRSSAAPDLREASATPSLQFPMGSVAHRDPPLVHWENL